MYKNLLLSGAVCLGLGACASTYEPIPYDRPTADVQSLAVMDDALPEKPTVYMAATVGSNFGLIGALIDSGVASSRKKKMLAIFDSQDVDVENVLEEALVANLTESGYEVSMMDDTVRENRKLMKSYDDMSTDADAYLDVVSGGYGYVSAGIGSPWRPSAHFKIRMVDSDTQDILMENYIAYNPLNYAGQQAAGGAITLTPNPEYAFEKMEDMEAAPDLTTEGIVDALQQVADTMAKLVD